MLQLFFVFVVVVAAVTDAAAAVAAAVAAAAAVGDAIGVAAVVGFDCGCCLISSSPFQLFHQFSPMAVFAVTGSGQPTIIKSELLLT